MTKSFEIAPGITRKVGVGIIVNSHDIDEFCCIIIDSPIIKDDRVTVKSRYHKINSNT